MSKTTKETAENSANEAKAATENAGAATRTSNVVTMQDGRSVDFGVRSKVKREISFKGEGEARVATVQFDVRTGQTFTKTIAMNDSLLMELAALGASSKIGDSVAQVKVDEDLAAGIEASIVQLNAGQWTVRAPAAAKGLSDFYTAVARYKGYETDEQKEALRGALMAMDDATQKGIRNIPEVQVHLKDIRAENAAAAAAKAAKDVGKKVEVSAEVQAAADALSAI